jgi:hypothetical protein
VVPTQDLIAKHAIVSYPLRSIVCPTHGLQDVLIGSHEQRGTVYTNGSYDTRWHEQAGCGCHFDVWYYQVRGPIAATVTIYAA